MQIWSHATHLFGMQLLEMKKIITKASAAIVVYAMLCVRFFGAVGCNLGFHTWILQEFKYTDTKDIGFKMAYKHKRCKCEKCGIETEWWDAFWGCYVEDLTLGFYEKDKWYAVRVKNDA